jgi:formyltetrahydrofolate deformylase
VLLMSCRDGPGIVVAVSGFIHRHGGNILHASQHSDLEDQRFFMRVEWDLAAFDLAPEAIHAAFAEVAARFQAQYEVHLSQHRTRVAILVSRYDHCLWDLLLRWRAGELACDVVLVASNHATAAPIAEAFGLAFARVPVEPATKPAAERELARLLGLHAVDLVVLARYMQVLSPELVAAWAGRIINVHHSFLPAFAGARPYEQAHRRGVKLIGATSHYVTAELDAGPIIDQTVLRVSHRDEVAELERKGKDLERLALASAVRLHLEHRVLVDGQRTVVFD